MCYRDDYGSSEFYSITYPKARKAHWCVECHVDIEPGTQYARHTQKWEGSVESTAFCVDCDAWATAFTGAQHEACGGRGDWLYGCLWEMIGEFTDEHLGYNHETGEPLKTEKQYRDEQEALIARMRSRVMPLDTTRSPI
jgi:hypothetical protein